MLRKSKNSKLIIKNLWLEKVKTNKTIVTNEMEKSQMKEKSLCCPR